jgi:hypothetical protein
MATNGDKITILYKIVNSDCDKKDVLFNAFAMSRGPRGPTLASVKQNCVALYGLNHLGPEGYHWRVCVEDKAGPGEASMEKSFSWWDIQDENAALPIKSASQFQLQKFFAPPGTNHSSSHDPASAAKGAFKSLGKAMSHAVSGSDDHGPPASVIAFKLLDVVKMHDDFTTKNHGRGGHIPTPHRRTPASATHPPSNARVAAPAGVPQQQRQAPQRAPAQAAPPQQQRAPTVPAGEPSLMDFGATPAGGASRTLHHRNSSPSTFNRPDENISKAQRIQQQYQKQKQTQSLVWDDIEQRYVQEGTIEGKGVGRQSSMGSISSNSSGKKNVGISLDASNAIGKSANVQAAVNKRVNEMRKSQQQALDEVRQREEKKKSDDDEEDAVRKRLEPKIKAWSEEYGKKKQLRALLGSLQTILWEGAKWKPVGIGDIMDNNKVKRCYLKATLVVHPDKTHHLDAEKRFLAKRIFDALSQAKKDFDEGK